MLRWAKPQGGFTGYPHRASGLAIDSKAAAARLLLALDVDGNDKLSEAEAAKGLLPEPFAAVDKNHDSVVTLTELEASHSRAADTLPNYAIPEMNGGGAMEICVSAAHGGVRLHQRDGHRAHSRVEHLVSPAELRTLREVRGETDFPCMSSTRVGQGRSYVQLGRGGRLEYPQWCRGIARGGSYVSDGYAHALGFTVNGTGPGGALQLAGPGRVTVKATVAFSPDTPLEPPYGGAVPVGGRRHAGDTVIMREVQSLDPVYQRGQRLVELIVNGRVAASREVPADGREHAVEFAVWIEQSSWVAVRQFPQLHTNPVDVLVAGRPIRASRESAQWAIACIDQLWRVRAGRIAPGERAEAERAYEEAKALYRRIAAESSAAR